MGSEKICLSEPILQQFIAIKQYKFRYLNIYTNNNYTNVLRMIMQGQKKSELALYVVLWTILFAAAAFSVYWDGLNPTSAEVLSGGSSKSSNYDWMGLLGTWKFLAQFCVFFFIHNFLVAPLLVYRSKRWLYGICVALLMLLFAWSTLQRISDELKPELDSVAMGAPWHGLMHEMQGRPHREIGNPPPPKGNLDREREKPDALKAKPFGGPTTVAFNIMFLLLGLNIGTKYYFKSLDDRKRMRDLERDNLNQQLQYLKYQINPHFFMNTLNNIHALVDIDPEEAKHTIEVLSKLMRYVLYDADKPMTSLQKEIEFLRHYIDLMRIRYTDRVRISILLPESVPEVQVPSLLFATFVENAFKHGISYQRKSFVEVSVRVNEAMRELDFCCNNSKKPEVEEKTKLSEGKIEKGGVGLKNAVKRLLLIYGHGYELKIDTNPEEHRLLLRLPFK